MLVNFEIVDKKISEVEFFLAKMIEAGSNWEHFQFYLSAYLSASRTTTLAIQRFVEIPGFDNWYKKQRDALKKDPIAKFMLDTRNAHVHGDTYPISGAKFYQGISEYNFVTNGKFTPSADIVSLCRLHFINLLKIIYDGYVKLGVHIDPQQFYTKEHFASLNKTIDDAEIEVRGWIMESYIAEGFNDDDRWFELRSYVGECSINHLFYGYLNKVTPQPILPDYLGELIDSYEDLGWLHIPAGFSSLEDYRAAISKFS